MTAEHLSNGFIESMEDCFNNWKPREKYTMEVI